MEFGFIEQFIRSSIDFIQSNGEVLFLLIPMLIVVELPLSITVISGILFWYLRAKLRAPLSISPTVSCIVTCYSEGDAIKNCILTLCEQIYPGKMQIIIVIDGAHQNLKTYQAAIDCLSLNNQYQARVIELLPKWQRGGRVSSLNAGLYAATGDIVINMDADTSFDNNMVYEIIREFEDPNVPAVAGSLRVRNSKSSFVTHMQNLEYMISMQAGKTGLAEWNLINNISGAFGAFRRSFLQQIGGWDTHTAEDLDLTVRIKQYMGRHPNIRIPFATKAIGHTDVPTTWKDLFGQRLRWDGDLVFLYLRKHRHALTPKLIGLKSFVFTFIYGVLQNILIPLIVIIFNLWIIITYNVEFFLGSLALQYIIYFYMSLMHFSFFLLAISERPYQDIKVIFWLFLFPIYTLIMRIFSVFAILNEIFRRAHEESNMAPWWVLKRGDKF